MISARKDEVFLPYGRNGEACTQACLAKYKYSDCQSSENVVHVECNLRMHKIKCVHVH